MVLTTLNCDTREVRPNDKSQKKTVIKITAVKEYLIDRFTFYSAAADPAKRLSVNSKIGGDNLLRKAL